MKTKFDPESLYRDKAEANERLKQLILYISEQSQDDPKFGNTKLNKILYIADMSAYLMYKEPITGSRYMKLQFGPVPKQMKPVLEDMIKEGDLEIVNESYFGKVQKRAVAKKEPNLSLFTKKQKELVDNVIHMVKDHDGKSISNATHTRIWRLFNDREEIPYTAAFISDEPMTEQEKAKARELAKEFS